MDVYLKGTYGLPEKRAARRAGQPVQELDYVHVPDEGYWMVKEPNQIKSVQNRGTFNPDDPNIYRTLPWAAGGQERPQRSLRVKLPLPCLPTSIVFPSMSRPCESRTRAGNAAGGRGGLSRCAHRRSHGGGTRGFCDR